MPELEDGEVGRGAEGVLYCSWWMLFDLLKRGCLNANTFPAYLQTMRTHSYLKLRMEMMRRKMRLLVLQNVLLWRSTRRLKQRKVPKNEPIKGDLNDLQRSLLQKRLLAYVLLCMNTFAVYLVSLDKLQIVTRLVFKAWETINCLHAPLPWK